MGGEDIHHGPAFMVFLLVGDAVFSVALEIKLGVEMGWGPLTDTKDMSTRLGEGQRRGHQLTPFPMQSLVRTRRGIKNIRDKSITQIQGQIARKQFLSSNLEML